MFIVTTTYICGYALGVYATEKEARNALELFLERENLSIVSKVDNNWTIVHDDLDIQYECHIIKCDIGKDLY